MLDFSSLWESISRKKTLDNDMLETKLNRCLSLFDLTMIGAGHMIGAGIFVVSGTVLKDVAGPGIILSYIIGGFAAFLSALCYAEFGARVPKAGSAYSYTYLIIGEFAAFMVGWNMLLESMIGGASVAKAWSGGLDVLFGEAISKGIKKYVGEFNSPLLSPYPDFLAALCCFVWMSFVASGAKISSIFNNILTFLNISILCLVMGIGLYFADLSNWTNQAKGGFLPYGLTGVLAGSATCFYSYVGFEGITCASEEAKNPSRNIPLAIGISVVLVSVIYVGASGALTLMVPYDQVNVLTPFSAAIMKNGSVWGTYFVGIGTLIGLSASILGGMFSIPRTAYAMALDGLIFKKFSYVNEVTQTPLLSIAVFGTITALVALFTDLSHLVELLSIGTLFCFTFVSINVIILRYQPADKCQFELKQDASCLSISEKNDINDTNKLVSSQSHEDIGKVKKQFVKLPGISKIPDGCIAPITISLLVFFTTAIYLVIYNLKDEILAAQWWAILLLTFLSICFLVSYFLLSTHQQNTSFVTFQVPLVPLIPVLSIVANIGLILKLNPFTWIRLGVWIAIGLVIYFGYSIRNSNENEKLLAKNTRISYSAELNGRDSESSLTLAH